MAPRLLLVSAMRVFREGDGGLLLALMMGGAVMVGQPLRLGLSAAEDIARDYGIDVLPALVILVLFFTLHLHQRHRDHAAAVALAERDAEEAKRWARDTERLVDASHALANVLDHKQLRVEVWRHVPALTGGRTAWIAMADASGWRWIMEPDAEHETRLTDLTPTLLQLTEAEERRHDGWALFQLRSSGRPLGVLGVEDTPVLSDLEEGRIDALAAILSIALKNVQLFDQMQVASVSDALTGCFNRAHAFATLENELRRSKRNRQPVSIVMVDVDDFKRINDEHGHLVGDTVLASLGETLRRTLRSSDVKCRYGGDEFMVVLPDTPLEGADQVAEHLRRAIEQVAHTGRSRTFSVHASLGIATALPGEADPLAVIGRADSAMYRDKGRQSHRLRLAWDAGAGEGRPMTTRATG
ncbi:MAG: GGDEF domain-containing protein [Vicinamibacterales bacterium]